MIRVRLKADTKALMDALKSLGPRVGKGVVRESLMAVAEPMRRRMSQLAPHRPGAPDIRSNIEISGARAEHGEVAVAVGPSREFRYGFYQEYGTVHHGAHPFMRPAFDTEAEKALEAFGRAMWTQLAGKGVVQFGRGGGPLQGGPGGGNL